MNFQGQLWVTLLAEVVSQPFGCKPYLLRMTWCHKEFGCKGKRQSHLAANDLFLDTILPKPRPPSFLGLQQTSQLTRWSLLESSALDQRKSLMSFSIFWDTAIGIRNRERKYKGMLDKHDWMRVILPPNEKKAPLQQSNLLEILHTTRSQKDRARGLPPKGMLR